jgi:16S rRNA (guanine527-N7)-methyltransferase
MNVENLNVEKLFKLWYDLGMELERYENLINGELYPEYEKLYFLLTEHNKMYNLTSITQKEEVFCKHFLDSVVGESYFSEGAKVAEIGSGGGFPSLPLKILRKDLSFTLIESTGKKCNYLQTCVDNLGLSGMCIKNIRAEDGAKEKLLREKFDFAVARAVARLNTLCEYCLPYVKVGGSFVAYKGDCGEEIEEASSAIKILGGKLKQVERYNLPGGDKRTLVVIEKVSSTPEKYPRGQGKERSKPL